MVKTMRNYPLSKRDIIKEANLDNFLKGFIEGSPGKLQELMAKPFETLFYFLGPMYLGRSFLGKVFWAVLQSYGIGASWLGALIDDLLGFGDPNNMPSLDTSKLKDASDKAADKIFNMFNLTSLSSEEEKMLKTAKIGVSSLLGKLATGKKVGLSNVFYSILSKFVKGLIGMGIIGGVKKTIQMPTLNYENKEYKSKEYVSEPKLQTYSNNENNIEETLIAKLNYKVNKVNVNGQELGFSDLFQHLRGYSLYGSTEMDNILKRISMLNQGATLEELNHLNYFAGPSLSELVKYLLPETKQVPSKKVNIPSEETIYSKKEKLKQLLKGVI